MTSEQFKTIVCRTDEFTDEDVVTYARGVKTSGLKEVDEILRLIKTARPQMFESMQKRIS